MVLFNNFELLWQVSSCSEVDLSGTALLVCHFVFFEVNVFPNFIDRIFPTKLYSFPLAEVMHIRCDKYMCMCENFPCSGGGNCILSCYFDEPGGSLIYNLFNSITKKLN